MYNDIQLLQSALEIYSPSGKEKNVAEFFVDQMEKRNFDNAYIDDVGNVIGIHGSGEKTILFMGHIDTVPGYLPVKKRDGILTGRGACDAKGGVSAAIAAVSMLSKEALQDRRIIIAGCVEEEIATSKGARYLLETFEEPDFLINGEPSGFDAITIGYKGCIRFEYDLKQKVTHHASAEPAANEHAFQAMRAIHDYLDNQEYKKETAFYTPYVEIRKWEHTRTGIDECIHIHGNVRIPPGFDRKAFMTAVTNIDTPGSFIFTETIDGIELSRSSYLARTFMTVMREKNIKPRCKVKTGSSDMNVVIEKWKSAQMLAYSPGDSKLDHTPEEQINVAEYQKSIEILSRVLRLL